jgi:NADH-quinone oxidoreductase subunit I
VVGPLMYVTRQKPSFVQRIFLLELLAGLLVTLRNQFRPHVTQEYPRERPQLRPRFRGVPRLRDHPEVEGPLCVACNQCAIDCPDQCITVIAEPRAGGKGKQPRLFLIDYEKCCLCGLCVDPCPTKPVTAIYMSHDYELAKESRPDFMTDLVRLYEGHDRNEYEK